MIIVRSVLAAIVGPRVMPGGAGGMSWFLQWCRVLLMPEALLDGIQDFLVEMLYCLCIKGHFPWQPLQLVYILVDFGYLFSHWVCMDEFNHRWLCPQVSCRWWLLHATADDMAMFFLPYGCGMDKHPVQQDIMVEPQAYPPFTFGEEDISIKPPFCLPYWDIFFFHQPFGCGSLSCTILVLQAE